MTFRAALSCGQLMSLTMMQAAHDKINHTLLKWREIIGSCHRWVDGERHETCSVLTDIVRHGGMGYNGPLKSVDIIDFHIGKFLEFSQRTTARQLEILLKESTDLPLIVKKIIWGYPLTRHQMIILMFYDLDFLMKTVDEVLKQNKFNPIYYPGFFEEARHRVAIAIEFIGAPMQMVLPKCETALKIYDTAIFGQEYIYPQSSVKLQK
jgi:hypothetical protein